MIIHGSKVEKVSAEVPDEGIEKMLKGHIMMLARTPLSFHSVTVIYYNIASYHISLQCVMTCLKVMRITFFSAKR